MKRLIEWFSTRLAERAARTLRAAYMAKNGGDEKCPHCNTWASERGGWVKHEQDCDNPELDRMTCHCGGQSQWLYGPGLFLLIDKIPKEAP
jgi:hypothetical protein